MLEKLNGKGIIIHHWDADGICSARLIMEKLKDNEIRNVTPILGNYYLTDEELQSYSKYDFVIVVDMALTAENIQKLAKKSKVMIFDHHLGKIYENVFHYNPVLKGGDPDKYPSASWILNDYLKNEVNLYALLGVIGDHEEKIKDNTEFWRIIQDFCKDNNTTFEDLCKMVYLLDSNYKLGDKKAVEQAPHILLNLSEPIEILNNQVWNKNLEKINFEIEKILNSPDEHINDLVFKKINTQYNIISTVTRKISWVTGKNTLVINTGFFNDKDQVYLRSKKDAEPLIKKGKELGFKCGGKKEVLGAVVPKDKTNMFIEEIILFLENKQEG